MSTQTLFSVRSSEADSWSELEAEETFSECDIQSSKSQYHSLGAIDPDYSATKPVARLLKNDLVPCSLPSARVDREIAPSISLSSTCIARWWQLHADVWTEVLSQRCEAIAEDISTKLDEVSSLLPALELFDEPAALELFEEPEPTILAFDNPQPTCAAPYLEGCVGDFACVENFAEGSGEKHHSEASHGIGLSPTVLVDTLKSLVILFGQVSWGSVRVIAAVAHSTFTVLTCSLSSDCIILGQVLKVWLLFVRHIYTALLFSGLVILLKVLSTVGWAAGFFPRKWPTQQESERAGAETSKPPGHNAMAPPADLTASQPPLGIPKSRTFSVISSLTQSFSLGSLASQKTSRNVSGESHASTAAHDQAIAHPTFSQQTQDFGDHDSTSLTPATPVSPPSLSINPRAISTAMPPQYWAGRFMALHDRFHNELLEPHHLTRLCEAQAAQPLPDFTRQASAAAQNNPSTSAYALTRSAQASKQPLSQNGVSRQPSRSRIPQSATSGAILQSTSYNAQPSLSFYTQAVSSSSKTASLPVAGHRHLPTTDENCIPEYPPSMQHPQTDTTTNHSHNLNHNHNHHHNHHPMSNPSSNTNNHPTTLRKIPSVTTTSMSNTHLTDDEPSRTRRVLLHLEYLCTTDAALSSLRQWQAMYARKTGRDELDQVKGVPIIIKREIMLVWVVVITSLADGEGRW
ncbi:hypothetical protein C8A01DRAFT_47394 [Parachaetomium inaequale]|uniref:Uncharacterized protein n=1 Tax=Parachaetomium inaequale TaxID=2588326 RepID=A0AAN6PFJ9_9PEZI|nr:hypothetical protein C8A01DRAFT_47394 [Parachaetomium inaequale]